MLRRYFITLGALTTAGGVVKTASTTSFIHGLAKAVEGDLVDCPVCGREGVIQVVPPRLGYRYKGKEYALNDDLCACGCTPAPKLLPNQQSVCQVLPVESFEEAGSTPEDIHPLYQHP
jgi:uncharacterized Zn-binding protein involved in type VI secretion